MDKQMNDLQSSINKLTIELKQSNEERNKNYDNMNVTISELMVTVNSLVNRFDIIEKILQNGDNFVSNKRQIKQASDKKDVKGKSKVSDKPTDDCPIDNDNDNESLSSSDSKGKKTKAKAKASTTNTNLECTNSLIYFKKVIMVSEELRKKYHITEDMINKAIAENPKKKNVGDSSYMESLGQTIWKHYDNDKKEIVKNAFKQYKEANQSTDSTQLEEINDE